MPDAVPDDPGHLWMNARWQPEARPIDLESITKWLKPIKNCCCNATPADNILPNGKNA